MHPNMNPNMHHFENYFEDKENETWKDAVKRHIGKDTRKRDSWTESRWKTATSPTVPSINLCKAPIFQEGSEMFNVAKDSFERTYILWSDNGKLPI